MCFGKPILKLLHPCLAYQHFFIVIVFALVLLNLKRKEAMALQQDGSALKAEFSIKKLFPWFILGFLAMSIVASILPIPAQLVSDTKTASKFLMVLSLIHI